MSQYLSQGLGIWSRCCGMGDGEMKSRAFVWNNWLKRRGHLCVPKSSPPESYFLAASLKSEKPRTLTRFVRGDAELGWMRAGGVMWSFCRSWPHIRAKPLRAADTSLSTQGESQGHLAANPREKHLKHHLRRSESRNFDHSSRILWSRFAQKKYFIEGLLWAGPYSRSWVPIRKQDTHLPCSHGTYILGGHTANEPG